LRTKRPSVFENYKWRAGRVIHAVGEFRQFGHLDTPAYAHVQLNSPGKLDLYDRWQRNPRAATSASVATVWLNAPNHAPMDRNIDIIAAARGVRILAAG